MAADRAIAPGVGYAAAKAAAEKPQPWLPVELAHALRVCVAPPGFFVGERSRWLLPSERGELTAEAPDHRPHARRPVRRPTI